MDLETATANRGQVTNFDRMEMCKVTKEPLDIASFACLFPTSLDTTATETRDAKDGSWIWRLQQPIAAKCTNFERMEEMCKVTDKSTDTVTLACLFFYISMHNSNGN